MIKKVFSFFLIFLISVIGVFAENGKRVRVIIENNSIFLDYSKSSQIRKLVNSESLIFRIEENKKLTLFHDKVDKKILFHFSEVSLHETGNIEILYKGNIYKLPYEVNYKLKENDLDLKDEFITKRIQKRALSCESSAAADIYTHLTGELIDEYKVFDLMDKSVGNDVAQKKGGIYIWGNPDAGFVGHVHTYKNKGGYDVRATQKGLTGYGVYEAPVAKVLNTLGLKTQIINKNNHVGGFYPNTHLSALLESIKKGYMVQLWGDWCTDEKYEDGTIDYDNFTGALSNQGFSGKNYCSSLRTNRSATWYYYDSKGDLKKHIGLKGEHVFYLLGYSGSIHNPTHIKVWDTATGYHKYDIKEWMRKWKLMSYRSLIVGK